MFPQVGGAANKRDQNQRDHHELEAGNEDLAARVKQALNDVGVDPAIGAGTGELNDHAEGQAGHHADEDTHGQIHDAPPVVWFG